MYAGILSSIRRGDGMAKCSVVFIALLLFLSGCTHNILIVGRNGVTGKAKVTTFGNHSGDITIKLGRKVYSGQWVYAPSGGAMGIGNTTASSGWQMVTATGNFMNLPMGGPGSVLASAPDGSRLRCSFKFSEWGRTGIGLCYDSLGQVYDMQIN